MWWCDWTRRRKYHLPWLNTRERWATTRPSFTDNRVVAVAIC